MADPISKANITSSLYLMDVISYISNSMKNLDEESGCKNSGSTCGDVWNGTDPGGQNIPKYLNAGLRRKLSSILGLSANPSQGDIEKLLNDPSSNKDLIRLVGKISNSTLSNREKAKAKAALYLMDVIGYIAAAMADLAGEKACRGNNQRAKAICDNIWDGEDPGGQNIHPRITASATDIRQIFALAGGVSKLQGKLENAYLKLPSSNYDLKMALCRIDSSKSYCPAIASITPTKINRGGTIPVPFTITGKNLPKNAKIEFLKDGKPDPKIQVDGNIVRSQDGKTLKFKVKVAKDAALGDRQVRISDKTDPVYLAIVANVPLKIEKAKKKTVKKGKKNGPGKPGSKTNPYSGPFLKRLSTFADRYQSLYGPEARYNNLFLGGMAGFNSFAWQRDGMSREMQALVDNSIPMIGILFNLGSLHQPISLLELHNALRGKNDDWGKISKNVRFVPNASFWGNYFYSPGHNPGHTSYGGFGLSLNPTFSFYKGKFFAEGILGYNFRGADYDTSNRFYSTGITNSVTGGAAFGSQGTWARNNHAWRARLSLAYNHSWIETDEETYPFDYTAQRSVLDLRLDAGLNFYQNSAYGGSVWLTAGATAYGYMKPPTNTGRTYYYNLQKSWYLETSFGMPRLKPVAWWGTLGASQYNQDPHKPVSSFYAKLGLLTPAGTFMPGYRYTDNPVLLFGQSQHTVSFMYRLNGIKLLEKGKLNFLRGLGAGFDVNHTAGQTDWRFIFQYGFPF